MGEEIDGDYGLFEDTLARADWTGFAARRAASHAAGRFAASPSPPHHATGGSTAELTVKVEADGTVTVDTGAQDSGQRHGDTLGRSLPGPRDIRRQRHCARGGQRPLRNRRRTGGSCLMPISAFSSIAPPSA